MQRCDWCSDNGMMQKYHDEEWGIPLHDDLRHFEYLLMEVMQCGLNWSMMLKKREIFKECFDEFDFYLIANYEEDKIEKILKKECMIKSRKKIEAIINNAKCFIKIIEEYKSFDAYIWSYTNNNIFIYKKHQQGQWEIKNNLSDVISKDMKKKGFKYLGSITIYSHLQACGIINDHEHKCWKYHQLVKYENIKYIE